jgi:hypothetical protein
MKYIPPLALAILAFGASAITAQVIYNSASTAAEGAANGMSNIIASQGQKNLNDSQAAINLTQARSSQIDNQVKSVNAFWEKRDIYDARVQQQMAKTDQRRNFYLQNHGITGLTPEEFDRTTGAIVWPKVLEQSQYNPYRLMLDKLFKQRAYAGALTGDEYMEAAAASKQWRALLGTQQNVYPQPILSQMIRFILKLDRELDDNLG